MIVRLFCPKCAYEAAQKHLLEADIEVPVPVSRLSDNGKYQVKCGAGHVTSVTLDNLKFELLFELGVNALVDGYPREAVSSFTSSLERFQEFFFRVVMAHFSVPSSAVETAWKAVSRQSERQLGAYISASLMLAKTPPTLLDPNKGVKFRNSVIHNGYVPNSDEAISFGDAVMTLINQALDTLRAVASDALLSTYASMSPQAKHSESDDDQHSGVVNILTTVDTRHPPKGDDRRVGSVINQFPRILDERQLQRMQLLSEEEAKRQFPEQFAL